MTYQENDQNTLRDSASHLANNVRTCDPRDTGLTQACSLDVLAHHLARLRPSCPADRRPLVSMLAEQCKRFHQNPEGLRPMMLRTIDAINADKR